MHLVVNHIPLTPAREVLAQESSAVRAQRALARLCLLWPQYDGIVLACVEVVGPEIRAPLRRQSVLRRFLGRIREAADQSIIDHDLRKAADNAVRALCAETVSLRVLTGQTEWDMASTPYRVWRQAHGGALRVLVRRETASLTAARAQALYTRLVTSAAPPRRRRHARR